MAVVRTGPRDVETRIHDIGPSGSGVDGLSAVGRLSALRVGDLVGDVAAGAGPIERRRATPEEIARLNQPAIERPTQPGPAMHVLRPAAAAMAASRARGNERMLALKAQRRAPRSAQGTADDREGQPGRVVGTPARTEAPLPAPKEEEPMAIAAAPPVVPCGDCLHEPVCVLKVQLAPYLVRTADAESITEPAPGLRLVDVVRLERIECDHQLPAMLLARREPIRAEHGGERWRTPTAEETKALRQPGHHVSHPAEKREKAERAARAVAALARHGGDRRAAAAELGMRPNALAMVLKFAHLHQATEATA